MIKFKIIPGTEDVAVDNAGKVRIKGKVLDFSNKLYEKIEFNWFGEVCKRTVADLYAVCFLQESKDPEVIKEIEGVCKTDSISDTYYSFKCGKLESNIPGFYHIPYYSNYVISEDGIIKSLRRNQTISVSRWVPGKKSTRGGYGFTGCYRDCTGQRGVSLHRLLALAFVTYTDSPFILVVNHINGKGEDNRLSNLEWVTRAANNLHAYRNNLLPNAVRPVYFLNFYTGDTGSFPSIAMASEELGIGEHLIRSRLGKHQNRVYPDGYLFKDRLSKWDVDKLVIVEDFIKSRETEVLSLATGKITLFDTSVQAASYLDVCSSLLHLRLRDNRQPVMNGHLARYKGQVSWNNIPSDIAKFLSTEKGIFYTVFKVTNIRSSESTFYPSLASVAEAFGKSLSTTSRYFLSGQSKTFPDYKFDKIELA